MWFLGKRGATVWAQKFGVLLRKAETAAPLLRNAILCASWIKHLFAFRDLVRGFV